MVDQLTGPFTTEAKQLAVQKEVKANYETYFARAAITRMWWPDRLVERNQMAEYGPLVSERTKEILLGFLGVESVVDDYVFSGIQAAGDSVSTRELYMQWGFEERRHGQTFRHSLIDSGLYSQQYVDKFCGILLFFKADKQTFNTQIERKKRRREQNIFSIYLTKQKQFFLHVWV